MENSNVISLQASTRKNHSAIDCDAKSEENIELDSLVWLSSHEAARYLRKSYGALKVMVYRGHIRARKFRRRLYFKRRELDQLLETIEQPRGF